VNRIDAKTLRAAMAHDSAPAILDVRLADDFAAGHIPGSKNNCVFEVAFDGRMTGIMPDKSAPVVVTGACEGSHEAPMAAEKLERLGYADVRILDGGLSEWIAAGGTAEATAPLPPDREVRDGDYAIDATVSRIGWRGRNVLNNHHGSIAIKSGRIAIQQGLPVSGGCVIDLNSIRCDDLAGDKLHDVLITHLCSHDFFDTALHPEARLVILRAERIAGACRGMPNIRLYTTLTLRGIDAPLVMDVAAGSTDDGRLAAQGAFNFDRTLWKLIYGSARFFHRLAGHLVNDLIEIDLKVVTR
jgi:rhodanese-related sulfurtransferase